MSRDRRTRVLRAQSSRGAAVFIWVACAVFIVLALRMGSGDGLLRFGPWAALAAWVGFAVLWRPCIILDPDGMTLVNVLKTHRIPFASISDLKVGMAVQVDADGRRYTSWGAPMPRGSFGASLEFESRSQIQVLTPTNERLAATSAVDPARESIRRAWENAKRNPSPQSAAPSSRWNVVNLVTALIWLSMVGAAVLR